MLPCVTMSEFDAIRPYHDAEVPEIVARLQDDPSLLRALAAVRLSWLARFSPWLAIRVARFGLRRRLARIRSVADVQAQVARLLTRLERETMAGFSVSGIEHLEPGVPCLFVANHRDIVLDSALLNWALHKSGRSTSFTAVGDNLVATPWVGDLMRLNKSFVVSRSITSPKAAFKAYSVTSAFIRDALERGESVWIAQRQGRAKDGNDLTDPAVLKMLTIAFRKDGDSVSDWLDRVRLIPVTVSYELDPCDVPKARELHAIEHTGRYDKAANEDLKSIARGLTGYKGRVHLHFGERIVGRFEEADALGRAIDQAIARGLRVFPVHRDAARRLGDQVDIDIPVPPDLPEVEAAWRARENECSPEVMRFVWLQYANIWRNAMQARARTVDQTIRGGSSSAAICSLSSST